MAYIHIADIDKNLQKEFKRVVYSQGKTIKQVIVDFMQSEIEKAEKKAKK